MVIKEFSLVGMIIRTYKGILIQFQVVKVIIVLLSGNLRVLEVLALDL